MTFRFSLFIAVVSILCTALIIYLFSLFAPPQTVFSPAKESCIILALDESHSDRSIREILASGGIEGFISESSQNVFVDDFGALRSIPLDLYQDEIVSFDPRDDGYAAKLRSFFVHEGKRFFFLFQDTGRSNAPGLEKQLAGLLEGIPFSFTVLGHRESLFLYFTLLAAACVFAFFLSPSKRLFVFQLPVLLAFGYSASFSFVFAAALTAVWELLREPFGQISAARCYDRGYTDYSGGGYQGFWEQLKPFRVNCLLVLLFLIFIVIISVVWELPPIPVAAGCGSFFLLYFLAFRAETQRAKKFRHILFTPVPILSAKIRTFSLFPLLLPFTAGALLSLFLPLFLPGFSPSRENMFPVEPARLISGGDYYRHIDFQSSFSYRPLEPYSSRAGGERSLNHDEYLRYYLGEDGLIAGSISHDKEGLQAPRDFGLLTEVPPFPLETLMEFLIHYDTPAAGLPSAGIWISVVFVLAACMLNLLGPKTPSGIRFRKKKQPFFEDKRIAA